MSERFCQKCGNPLEEGNFFCQNCGAKQESASFPFSPSGEKICPRCKSKIPQGDTFCDQCGAAWNAGKTPQDENICFHCGSEIPRGDVFCDQCGAPRGVAPQKRPRLAKAFKLVLIYAVLLAASYYGGDKLMKFIPNAGQYAQYFEVSRLLAFLRQVVPAAPAPVQPAPETTAPVQSPTVTVTPPAPEVSAPAVNPSPAPAPAPVQLAPETTAPVQSPPVTANPPAPEVSTPAANSSLAPVPAQPVAEPSRLVWSAPDRNGYSNIVLDGPGGDTSSYVQGRVLGDKVRFRSGHSTGSTIITEFYSGMIVDVLQRYSSGQEKFYWFKARNNGETGWIYGEFLSVPDIPSRRNPANSSNAVGNTASAPPKPVSPAPAPAPKPESQADKNTRSAQLISQGKNFWAKGDWANAYKRFDEAYKLTPAREIKLFRDNAKNNMGK